MMFFVLDSALVLLHKLIIVIIANLTHVAAVYNYTKSQQTTNAFTSLDNVKKKCEFPHFIQKITDHTKNMMKVQLTAWYFYEAKEIQWLLIITICGWMFEMLLSMCGQSYIVNK